MNTPPRSAKLALSDGTVFTGRAFGAEGEIHGEVVFNTSMTGYQEILTDPSYSGQIVTMTYPQIGNYGVNSEDVESGGLFLNGFIVSELCRLPEQLPVDLIVGCVPREEQHHRTCRALIHGRWSVDYDSRRDDRHPLDGRSR